MNDMDEYIEREAAIAAAFSATSLGNSAFRDVYDTVNRLRLIPSADVAPVRHGRWEKNDDGIMIWWECSECHLNAWYDGDNLYDYCPNCGARCDLEDTDDK